MMRKIAVLVSAFALVAMPASAAPGQGKGKGKGKSGSHCTLKRGFTVRGTLKDFTPDDPATEANEEEITIEVTGANKHARRSGEIDDQNPSKPGVQVKGAEYSVSGDPFRYKLVGYSGSDTPSEGDKVRLVGKIKYTKKRCAPEGTSVEDRYGEPNIRKATIKDADPD